MSGLECDMISLSSHLWIATLFTWCLLSLGDGSPALGVNDTHSEDSVKGLEITTERNDVILHENERANETENVFTTPREEPTTEEFSTDYDGEVDVTTDAPQEFTEEEARLLLDELNEEGARRHNELALLSWNYSTNITDHNNKIYTEALKKNGEIVKERWNKIMKWKTKWPLFKNETLKRQFELYSVIGDSALPAPKYNKLVEITTKMEKIYSTAKVCEYRNASICNLSLDPDLKAILKSSRDYDELTHAWRSWRDAAGKPSRNLFKEYVQLKNEAAKLNGFQSFVEVQLRPYESETFEDELESIYQELRPLYQQLHAYARRKLREVYGEERIPKQGPIPAHITGNMWAQSWDNIYDLLVPFPNKTFIDITPKMKELNFTPTAMFELAEDFFTSLGFARLNPEFWNRSMIEKPDDREVVCHASAWDFRDAKDFRIKQCTSVNMNYLWVTHHELGHVQYYMEYKHLPYMLRRGANPGFHEAVGDLMELSASTPKHLLKIGLIDKHEPDDEADINFLLDMALKKIAFLPFSYLVDKYRWHIYRGEIAPNNYTKAWWEMRYDLQGLSPPVERTEEDFDPAAKYHVSGDVGYIRYFASTILQFQFYESACLLAKEYDPDDPQKPLHRCDFYGSLEAGKAIRDMLSLGSSIHWKEAIKLLTGNTTMSASALRHYFSPLEKWLAENNAINEESVGWKDRVTEDTLEPESILPNAAVEKTEELQGSKSDQNKTAEVGEQKSSPLRSANASLRELAVNDTRVTFTEEEAEVFMRDTNVESSQRFHDLAKLSWNYQTNIIDANRENLLRARNLHGQYSKDRWNEVQKWKTIWPTFNNASLKRQFELFSVLGVPALQKDKFEQFNILTAQMREDYSTAKICDYKNSTKCDLSLEPDIEAVLKSSRDYEELTHVWRSWRDVVGRPARRPFAEMVELLNEAARLNGFSSAVELWTYEYDSPTFESDIERLFNQLRPLYEQLHAYTRRKLREVYGEDKVSRTGPIPAHVTGNMWAQSWLNIYDLLVPYPNKTSIDVTNSMVEQGYTPRKMFETANEFFVSLGMESVPTSFWNLSMIERPEGREVLCHASAWDFADRRDFRIKQCTEVDMEDFTTVHHEMGHLQYYMQYKDLPFVFRRGANPGFHEAVGDVIDLSVSTPKHLHKLGLLQTYEADDELDINFLLRNSLKKVAFLPFAYLIDRYRWDVFMGRISPQNYTKAWWDYRFELQGLEPPVPRTEDDFDPAAKSHVSTNTRYIRYFIANILQFQFHKAICLLAREYDQADPAKPLHRCDIYQSKEAGRALSNMLKLGASKHWSHALKEITGSEVLDASALREYFSPLEKWLRAENEKHGEFVGWKADSV